MITSENIKPFEREIPNIREILSLIDWSVSDMQIVKGFQTYGESFLHYLNFVTLLQKTVYDTLVSEILDNNLYSYIVDVKEFLLFIYLFDWL